VLTRPATATLRESGFRARPFVVGSRRTPHVRHRRKYALAPLPPHRRFHFRRPDGSVLATADDLAEFGRLLGNADAAVVAHHLEHGDFSRWITGTVHDSELGASWSGRTTHTSATHARPRWRSAESSTSVS
jgi:hypothetical protein